MAKAATLTVREHLRRFLRPLTAAERTRLEESLLAHGCQDPLIVWKDGKALVLVDGHHRYDICRAHKLPYQVVEREFESEEAVLRWMVRNGEGRRSMTRSEIRYYIGARYLREKQKREDNLKRGDKGPKYQGDTSGDTAERIAKEEGVSRPTVHKAAKFAAQVDEADAHVGHNLKWVILSEQMAFTAKMHLLLLESSPEEAIAAIRAAREAKPDKPVGAAALSKRLAPEEADAAPAGQEPFDPQRALGPIFDVATAVAEKVSVDELQTMVLLMKSYVTNLENRLKRRRQEA